MSEKEVRKLAAVMFTDIEGYSSLVQQDETAALKKVSSHRQFLEQYTTQYNGRVIAFYGDGSLSIYESAVDAVYCAIQMQRAYRAENPVPVRIGIHLGDIIMKEGTVFGDGVNISSRIQATGIAGSVLISGKVQHELINHPDIHTRSLGHHKLKNIKEPVEIFAVAHEGLAIPAGVRKIPGLKKIIKILPILLVAAIVIWFIQRQLKGDGMGTGFKEESISVPVFTNHTGDTSLNHIGQMASHWITKELSSTPNAHVVSYESASEMIKLAGVNLSSTRGRSKYASLTGAINVIEANYARSGKDSLLMSGFFKNLETGDVIKNLPDVRCSAADPMECIQLMAGNIKGYWVSRGDVLLTPPNMEAYKAYLAARALWRTPEKTYVFEQLNKAITLDSTFIDPYFLMLDFFYNEGNHEAANDTLLSIRKKFPVLDKRQKDILDYHSADINGRNKDAYNYFVKSYARDSMDLFTNNSAMVLALMYRQDPVSALKFFHAIPFDSLHLEGCSYCGERLELAMWSALDTDSMELADELAPKISNALHTHQSYGMLIMYYAWKKDTMRIDLLLKDAKQNPQVGSRIQYLTYLTSRFFLLRGEKELSIRYAGKAIAASKLVTSPNVRTLARSYYLADQLDNSFQIYQSAKPKDELEAKRIASEVGTIHARKGNKTEAMKSIEKLDAMHTPFEYGIIEYYQARIYTLLGEHEKAVALLAQSIQKGQKFELWTTFAHDPDLMALKDYQPYKDLIALVVKGE